MSAKPVAIVDGVERFGLAPRRPRGTLGRHRTSLANRTTRLPTPNVQIPNPESRISNPQSNRQAGSW
jgi:hypothetical protein